MDNKQNEILQEAKNIREKYIQQRNETEDKMTSLRKLDESAEKPGKIISFTIGIISALVLGVGMCCTMVWTEKFFVLGIIVGIIGLIGIAVAYPLYTNITKKQRAKIASQVLRLADEIIDK